MGASAYFREQAELCRRWAKLVGDAKLRLRLLELGLHFEAKADELEDRARADRKPDPSQ